MIRTALKGLGILAYGDPPPGPGVPRGLSHSPNQAVGRIPLVSSRGVRREATYRDIYRTNPFVYAATNYIARGIGRLPLHLYTLDRTGEKVRIRSDLPGASRTGPAALDRLLNMPQGRVSRSAFYSGMMRQRLIMGNALWELQRDSRGVGMPSGIIRVPWTMVSHVEEDSYGNALFYELRDPRTMKRRVLSPVDVIHFGLGTEGDEACGVSLLESCSKTLALHEVLLRHLLGYFENAARPSGHLHVERANRDKIKELRELLTALYASPENAGQILVTSGKWEKTGDSPEHSQIVELLAESRVEIAASFQVPPPVLGLLEHAIRANVKEMREQFGRETVGPWATETEDELEAQLIKPLFESVECELQLAEQLRPDLEARALVYQRLMWVYSIDEIRQEEGKPSLGIKGVTDVPWVASGAMPVTTAAQQRTAAPPTAVAEGPPLEQVAETLRMLDAYDEAVAKNGNGELQRT